MMSCSSNKSIHILKNDLRGHKRYAHEQKQEVMDKVLYAWIESHMIALEGQTISNHKEHDLISSIENMK